MRISLLLALTLAPLAVHAQGADSVFARAERLVREGDGARGRELVDSVLAAAPAGSATQAEALYWRAALAASTEDAERDFRRIVVEFSSHPRAEGATLRLAQLELARGDRERALAHLQRFDREFASSPQRAWAALMLGRLYLDQQDLPRGCAAIGTARATAPATAVELRNQIDFFAPRCVGVDTASVERRAASVEPARQQPDADRRSRPEGEATPDARRSTPAAAGRYTIQLAAFNTQREAQSLVDALTSRRVEARVVGAAKPFRVRTGHYATRAEANEALRALKAKRLNGFVTDTER